VIRDHPGHARPRLMVCFGGRPVRYCILVHSELFPAMVHIISAVFVIHSAFLGRVPQSHRKK
jgi:hypothetical protein